MTLPPLILLHGALADARQMRPLAEALADRYTVYRPTLHGHGTRPAKGAFTAPSFVEDIRAYLDAEGLARADFFGYSLGGYVAIALAVTAPERVGRIFTLGTKYVWTPDKARAEVRMLDPAVLRDKVPAFADALARTHEALGYTGILEATRDMMLHLGDAPPLDLAGVLNPVQVAVGDRDTTADVADSLAVSRTLPRARFQVIPGLSHPFEKADIGRLADDVHAFLQAPMR